MLCKKNEKNCINATRRAPNRARHFFCLYAALVCGVCFALPAFADGDCEVPLWRSKYQKKSANTTKRFSLG